MSILNVLESGLPVLLLHFLVTLALLALGAFIYVRITPYRELTLIREGNMAAGTLFAGTLVSLAIPLAATLATSPVALDILVWGLVALILQLLTFGIATLVVRHFRDMIEAGNCAAALGLVGVQIAVALLNAGAMAG
jgi:putative membrane protein